MRVTAGEVRMNSEVIYSWGLLHMDEQRQDDQLEPMYNSSVPIQDIALKTFWEWWTIETGGERGSGRSVLTAWYDDDNDEEGSINFKTEVEFTKTEMNNNEWYINFLQNSSIGTFFAIYSYKQVFQWLMSWIRHLTASDVEAPVLEFWWIWSTLPLPLLPVPLLLRLVVPVRVPSLGQIELFYHLQRIIIYSYLKPYSSVQIICII